MGQLLREEGLEKILSRINKIRHSSQDENWKEWHKIAEEIIESLFNSSHHFAIYGSLAPGKSNHVMIEDIPGQWLEGYVQGKLHESGWGSDIGFPGIVWQPSGPKVKVHLFMSDQLPEHWQRLDQFEGVEYQRSLVPVHDDKGIITVANIYEIRKESFVGK
jgi:gamma-glutamylcyclotransferase (GGCT)/AIG2-like uncharacterized protein YtfP